MRLGIRTKQVAGVTAIVAVAALVLFGTADGELPAENGAEDIEQKRLSLG